MDASPYLWTLTSIFGSLLICKDSVPLTLASSPGPLNTLTGLVSQDLVHFAKTNFLSCNYYHRSYTHNVIWSLSLLTWCWLPVDTGSVLSTMTLECIHTHKQTHCYPNTVTQVSTCTAWHAKHIYMYYCIFPYKGYMCDVASVWRTFIKSSLQRISLHVWCSQCLKDLLLLLSKALYINLTSVFHYSSTCTLSWKLVRYMYHHMTPQSVRWADITTTKLHRSAGSKQPLLTCTSLCTHFHVQRLSGLMCYIRYTKLHISVHVHVHVCHYASLIYQ